MGVFLNENATERPLPYTHHQGKWSRSGASLTGLAAAKPVYSCDPLALRTLRRASSHLPLESTAAKPMTIAKILRCPICRKEVALDSPDAPFCSDRCRTIDLGKWASGDYRISSPILDPDRAEDIEDSPQ